MSGCSKVIQYSLDLHEGPSLFIIILSSMPKIVLAHRSPLINVFLEGRKERKEGMEWKGKGTGKKRAGS